MENVQNAYQRYGKSLALSFNGGKESTVILDLAIKQLPKILIYYVMDKNEFPEILKFIDEICQNRNINLLVYYDMKEAISDLKNKGIEAILTGVRKADDFSTQLYSKTEKGWPEIMRVNPLLDWSYSDVWNYILSNKVSYCKLYDMGYTSLGNTNNTFTNLKLFNGTGYDSAYKLQDESYERIARVRHILPKTISGKVIHGKGIAKKVLGIPTANLAIDKLELDEGVYYGKLNLDLIEYICVVSYGFNLTTNDRSFEVHILDFRDSDIYNKIITTELIGYIRPMEKFSNLSDLKIAIQNDINFVKFITNLVSKGIKKE